MRLKMKMKIKKSPS